MSYITLDHIKSRIPEDTLIDALDDDHDGEIDSDVWQAVQDDASNAVDSILGQRFAVPFSAPIPPIVVDAARIFALEILFQRRGYHTEEDNPWKKDANSYRTKLSRIATSDEPLTPTVKGQGSVKVISEPMRTQSSGGSLSA